MDDRLLEPLKFYEQQGKQEHADNVEAHFQKLVTTSGVDVEANRETVRKWKEEQKKISELSKVLKKFKILRGLLIFGIVVGAIMAIASIGMLANSNTSGILLLLIGVGATVGSIMLLKKKVNPVIKETDRVMQEHRAEAQRLENEGWGQMLPLNSLFTDYDAVRLVEKTLPDFSFDKNFTKEQERLFIQKYDFYDMQDIETSMVDTLSGRYAGNPFIFGRRRVHTMGSYTYHGTLTITWTETYRDSQGNVRTRQRSQTLHASLTKPKPYYHLNTFLLYGNQAAPNLSFSRQSQHVEDLSEKALERKIRKGERKLQKQASKAIKTGGNFQEMANSEFDVLFGATDRDNEVEFRFMYTPIGQRSTVALLKDDKNYGDDFDFIKQRKCNIIISEHAQGWKMNILASDYKHFDFDEIHERFTSLNEAFFRSVFFDFAPLFCVPAYLDEPCASLDDYEPYKANYTYYEHEVMSNSIGYHSFVHEDSCTEAILKTHAVSSKGGTDLVAVTAYSYMGVDRLDFVPVMGGDGNCHLVPVPWIEYIPLEKTTHINVGSGSEPCEKATVCYHDMSAGILDD